MILRAAALLPALQKLGFVPAAAPRPILYFAAISVARLAELLTEPLEALGFYMCETVRRHIYACYKKEECVYCFSS